MEVTAGINTNADYNSAGEPVNYDFEWTGPKDGILGISGELMLQANREIFIHPDDPQIFDTITFGPFELVILEHQLRPVEIYYCIRREFVSETK
jgi:hypothetical protein